jgi:hypothetical protein
MGLIFAGKDYGNDCLLCFGEGYTPKYIMASFNGISPTDWIPPIPPFPPYPDPNVMIQLEQQANPCQWLGSNGYWRAMFEIREDGAYLAEWAILPWPQAFAGYNASPCNANFTNLSQDPEANVTHYGGYGQIAAI